VGMGRFDLFLTPLMAKADDDKLHFKSPPQIRDHQKCSGLQ
jgi:hypothetical protein